jgi:hypothetical protein
MAFKSAIGKTTTISTPAAGTIKPLSSSTATVGMSLSKASKNNFAGVEKTESALPAEIVALVDFNRVHATAGTLKDSVTPYGKYYDALDSIHSITTDDVSYAISKALANDASGAWTSLKKKTDADIIDSNDFVEDLSNFLDSLEQAERSLDICRAADTEIQQSAVDFLSPKLKIYEKKAEDRTFDALNVIGQSTLRNTNADSLRKLLDNLKETLTQENTIAYNSIIEGLSQKSENDLNSRTEDTNGKAFNLIDTLGQDITGKLTGCSELLSQIFLISSGITKVKNDPINVRISFDENNISAIFEGASVASPLPFRKILSSGNLGSNSVTLSLIQFDGENGQTVIPVETEDSSKQFSYKSGPAALIRAPLRNGDYTFASFDSFAKQFEKNRLELETYLELMLGYLDPKNKLVPSSVLRTIIENFIKGLNLAISSPSAFFELHAFSLAAQHHSGFGDGNEAYLDSNNESAGVENLRQELLRTATTLKYNRLVSSVSTSQGEGGSQYPTTLSTYKTSDGESLASDAKATTTQVENKNPVVADRDFESFASPSPPGIIESMIHRQIILLAKEGIRESNNELASVLADRQKQYDRAIIDRDNAYQKAYDKDLNPEQSRNTTAWEVYYALKEIAETLKRSIDELVESINKSPKYVAQETLLDYYRQARKTTSGTFTSTLLDTYEALISAAKSRISKDSKFTTSRGLTNFGQLDELGIISLIIECYVMLASQISFKTYKDGIGGIYIPTMTSSINLLKNDLSSILSATSDSDLSFTNVPGIVTALSDCSKKEQSYQDSIAYLSAFSSSMEAAKNNLKISVADLLNNANRQNILDTAAGREMLESLTSQQLIYRRALNDRYAPNINLGYLPARVAYSADESKALDFVLSSPPLSNKASENSRIVFSGVPAGTINSNRRYTNKNIGNVKYSGMIELTLHHHDHEFEDLIFKEKIFLFDPQLYATPTSFDGYLNVKASASNDPVLNLAKRMRFTLYDRNGSQVLDYNSIKSNERYKDLKSSQIDEIIKNTLLSYLLESYTFKLSGMLFDESVSLKIDDTISNSGYSAITTTAAQGLTDLKFPTATQLTAILGADNEINFTSTAAGVTSGDRELISAIASSYLVKTERPIDRLIVASAFDRVFAVVIDPDEFEIDQQQSIKENGTLAKTMIESLTKQSLIFQKGEAIYFKPRDPSAGGFSIGSVSAQFVPHTVGKETGALLQDAKDTFNSKLGASSLKLATTKTSKSSSTKKLRI